MSECKLAFPAHKAALFLTHNEHLSYYETVEQWLASSPDRFLEWENAEARQRAIDSNECWTLQWYPETPVGFHIVAAPTLEECLGLAARRG